MNSHPHALAVFLLIEFWVVIVATDTEAGQHFAAAARQATQRRLALTAATAKLSRDARRRRQPHRPVT
ncbi:MAG: hypothetical protein KA257_14040 [Opitutaceae bacterium]|nr:hypothetical protein [Opitutaceae bacterium]MBP9911996.1 hypothetical protein [Opitutaceae bacterium]